MQSTDYCSKSSPPPSGRVDYCSKSSPPPSGSVSSSVTRPHIIRQKKKPECKKRLFVGTDTDSDDVYRCIDSATSEAPDTDELAVVVTPRCYRTVRYRRFASESGDSDATKSDTRRVVCVKNNATNDPPSSSSSEEREVDPDQALFPQQPPPSPYRRVSVRHFVADSGESDSYDAGYGRVVTYSAPIGRTNQSGLTVRVFNYPTEVMVQDESEEWSDEAGYQPPSKRERKISVITLTDSSDSSSGDATSSSSDTVAPPKRVLVVPPQIRRLKKKVRASLVSNRLV